MMHSCTAKIGGLWNRLSEALSTEEGQPLRAFRIHGQPPLSRVAQEADFARRAYTGKPRPNDVRDLVGDDVFTVWAEPEAAGDMRTAANLQATGIDTIVVRPRGDNEGRQTVHPLSVGRAGQAADNTHDERRRQREHDDDHGQRPATHSYDQYTAPTTTGR